MPFWDVFTDAFNGVKDTASNVFGGVKSAATGIYDKVLEPAYNKVIKPIGQKGIDIVTGNLNRIDKLTGAADKAIDSAGKAAEGIGNFLSGDSNFLLYLGVGAAALLVLPKIIDRVL